MADRTPHQPADHRDPFQGLGQTVPLEPGRDHDMPAGPHVGPGAALNVPVSQGRPGFVLDGTRESDLELMAREPPLDPLRHMEAGSDWNEETERRVHELDVPIRPPTEF